MVLAINGTVILCFNIFILPDFKFWRFLVKFTVSPFPLIFFSPLLLCPSSLSSRRLVSLPASEPAVQPYLECKTFFNLTFRSSDNSFPT